MKKHKDKNGKSLKIGDTVVHAANPEIKGKILKRVNEKHHYLKSSWIEIEFDTPVMFSGNSGRTAKDWICSCCLLEKQ